MWFEREDGALLYDGEAVAEKCSWVPDELINGLYLSRVCADDITGVGVFEREEKSEREGTWYK